MAAGSVGVSDLLASAFSSSLNCTVVTHDQFERKRDDKKSCFEALDIARLFNLSQLTGAVGDLPPNLPDTDPSLFTLFVKTLTGKTVEVKVAGHMFVADIKEQLQEIEGMPPVQQRLIYGGQQLEDSVCLHEYGIERESTLYMVLRLRGGGCVSYYIDDSLLHPEYDYDFSMQEDDGTPFYCGQKRYFRPYGWKRFALKVLDRYEDNTWLGRPGYRTNSSTGEWAVSYHGTAATSSGSIAQEGYDLSKGKRFLYGRGIYSSPSIDVAAKYAQIFTHNGAQYQIVFQNRVSVDNLSCIDSPHGDYWVQPVDMLLRPYGICIRRVV